MLNPSTSRRCGKASTQVWKCLDITSDQRRICSTDRGDWDRKTSTGAPGSRANLGLPGGEEIEAGMENAAEVIWCRKELLRELGSPALLPVLLMPANGRGLTRSTTAGSRRHPASTGAVASAEVKGGRLRALEPLEHQPRPGGQEPRALVCVGPGAGPRRAELAKLPPGLPSRGAVGFDSGAASAVATKPAGGEVRHSDARAPIRGRRYAEPNRSSPRNRGGRGGKPLRPDRSPWRRDLRKERF